MDKKGSKQSSGSPGAGDSTGGSAKAWGADSKQSKKAAEQHEEEKEGKGEAENATDKNSSSLKGGEEEKTEEETPAASKGSDRGEDKGRGDKQQAAEGGKQEDKKGKASGEEVQEKAGKKGRKKKNKHEAGKVVTEGADLSSWEDLVEDAASAAAAATQQDGKQEERGEKVRDRGKDKGKGGKAGGGERSKGEGGDKTAQSSKAEREGEKQVRGRVGKEKTEEAEEEDGEEKSATADSDLSLPDESELSSILEGEGKEARASLWSLESVLAGTTAAASGDSGVTVDTASAGGTGLGALRPGSQYGEEAVAAAGLLASAVSAAVLGDLDDTRDAVVTPQVVVPPGFAPPGFAIAQAQQRHATAVGGTVASGAAAEAGLPIALFDDSLAATAASVVLQDGAIGSAVSFSAWKGQEYGGVASIAPSSSGGSSSTTSVISLPGDESLLIADILGIRGAGLATSTSTSPSSVTVPSTLTATSLNVPGITSSLPWSAQPDPSIANPANATADSTAASGTGAGARLAKGGRKASRFRFAQEGVGGGDSSSSDSLSDTGSAVSSSIGMGPPPGFEATGRTSPGIIGGAELPSSSLPWLASSMAAGSAPQSSLVSSTPSNASLASVMPPPGFSKPNPRAETVPPGFRRVSPTPGKSDALLVTPVAIDVVSVAVVMCDKNGLISEQRQCC